MKKMKIISVDRDQFITESGDVFPHFSELDDVPTAEEFQKIYDYWFDLLNSKDIDKCHKKDS